MQLSGMQEYLNIEEGVERIRGNRQLYKTLLVSFEKNNYHEQLCGEMDAGDLEAASRTAHAIKGMAANLSMAALRAAAADLEEDLKVGESHGESRRRMEEAIGKTMEAVKRAQEAL